jgi:hypothetical protein
MVVRSHAVPQSLAPLAGQLLAGLLLFLLFNFCAGYLLRKHEERRAQLQQPRKALWERIAGAVLGTAWGAFLVIFVLIGIHLIGSVEDVLTQPPRLSSGKEEPPATAAETQANGSIKPAQPQVNIERVEAQPQQRVSLKDGKATLASSTAAKANETKPQPPPERRSIRLKRQIELSVFGPIVRKVDPVGDKLTGVFQNLTIVVSNRDLYEKFTRHPVIARFTQDAKMRALSEDKQIQQLLQQKQYYDLLDNTKVASLLGDTVLFGELKEVDLDKILKEIIEDNAQRTSIASSEKPLVKCPRCMGSDGKYKDAFKTGQDASQYAAAIQKEGDPPLNAYECPFGNGWHLTKTKNAP